MPKYRSSRIRLLVECATGNVPALEDILVPATGILLKKANSLKQVLAQQNQGAYRE